MNTYTITDGSTVMRGKTALEVMRYILGADGYEWEIRDESSRVDGCRIYQIYRSTASANSPIGAREMTAHGRPVVAASPQDAHEQLAAAIVTNFTGWRGFHGEVMTDSEYTRLMSED